MRKLLLGAMLLCSITSATSAGAQLSVGIGLPGVSIGINLPVYPQLVPVPGYPVHYAPQVSSNYFFYDGMYWVYQRDNWYASSWYNGPNSARANRNSRSPSRGRTGRGTRPRSRKGRTGKRKAGDPHRDRIPATPRNGEMAHGRAAGFRNCVPNAELAKHDD